MSLSRIIRHRHQSPGPIHLHLPDSIHSAQGILDDPHAIITGHPINLDLARVKKPFLRAQIVDISFVHNSLPVPRQNGIGLPANQILAGTSTNIFNLKTTFGLRDCALDVTY
jgi:hypothetical protein